MSVLEGIPGAAEAEPARFWIELDQATFRLGEEEVFPRTTWNWRRGQVWAVLGPNGGGKSLFLQAIQARLPRVGGEARYDLVGAMGSADDAECMPERAIVEVSPLSQREFVRSESSYYQSRWHGGVEEGARTVSDFLSQASVEQILPFEVGASRSDPGAFERSRANYLRLMGLRELWERRLALLSNGEQRKVLLVHALLRSPRLLLLDDPYGGLDAATREHLKTVIDRLLRRGTPVLVATSRIEEVPERATHLMFIEGRRLVEQGPKEILLPRLRARLRQAGSGLAPRHRAKLSVVESRANRATKPAPSPARSPASGAAPRDLAPAVELDRVTIESGTKRLLDRLSWRVGVGERWALFGPNGAGKTTLLSLIQGDHPQVYAHAVRWFGRGVSSTQSLWQVRSRIGWLSPELNLHYPPEWPCLDVVCSGFRNSIGLYQPCSPRQRALARRWLGDLGLVETAARGFGEISTGLQRLVLLARAAVRRPSLLILDEPCQGVDAHHRQAILDAVDRLAADGRMALIFVSHHRHELPACITHTLELRRGRVVAMNGTGAGGTA